MSIIGNQKLSLTIQCAVDKLIVIAILVDDRPLKVNVNSFGIW